MAQHPRYTRQVILPEIGDKGQTKISQASVFSIGAGGRGCPALLYLAAAGVGRIGIVDFDTVEETNLQRQVLFTTAQVGANKADTAKIHLNALNPDITIESYAEELTAHNAPGLFQQYDVIIDGTDNFATKFLINDTAVKTGKPFVYGAILSFNGQLSVFHYKDGPCYRCLFPKPPTHHIPNCANAGVMGAVAGMIGTAQAMEAIKIIVTHDDLPPLSGKLWNIDMRNLENKTLSLPKHEDCPTCAIPKHEIVLKDTPSLCASTHDITVNEIHNTAHITFIDVRETEEWHIGHIDGAKHLPLSSLLQHVNPKIEIALNQDIIVYCQKGIRGQHAAHILRQHGYANTKNMAGGYEAWLEHAGSKMKS